MPEPGAMQPYLNFLPGTDVLKLLINMEHVYREEVPQESEIPGGEVKWIRFRGVGGQMGLRII